jgi:predicted small lipoprotein YifL
MLRTGLFALCILFSLAACGQKGDLYLPAAQSSEPQTTAQPHG